MVGNDTEVLAQILISRKATSLGISLKLGKKGGIARIGGTPTSVTSTDIIRDEYDEELYYGFFLALSTKNCGP